MSRPAQGAPEPPVAPAAEAGDHGFGDHGFAPEAYRRYVNPSRLDLLLAAGGPPGFVGAEGSWLVDRRGRRFLDLVTGFGTATLGHGPPVVRQALHRVLDAGRPFTAPQDVPAFAGPLAEKLCGYAGAGLTKVYFGNSGTEGVETAMKLAMAHTGRAHFVTFEGGYHGSGVATTALAGAERLRDPFPGLPQQIHRVPFGDLDATAAALARYPVAAVVLEVVQGMGGARPWPGGEADLDALAALCREHGTLLVVDEVLTGLGRAGRWYAFQRSAGLEPDVVIVAKGLGGGMIPVCAVLMSEPIYRSVFGRWDRAQVHASTFQANALALSSGLAMIDELERGDWIAKASAAGAELRRELEARIDADGDLLGVRGEGLLLGLRIANQRREGEDLWGAPRLREQLFRLGVVTQTAAQAPEYLLIMPPFTFADDERALFLECLDEALGD